MIPMPETISFYALFKLSPTGKFEWVVDGDIINGYNLFKTKEHAQQQQLIELIKNTNSNIQVFEINWMTSK
jgi:hypothetical protein